MVNLDLHQHYGLNDPCQQSGLGSRYMVFTIILVQTVLDMVYAITMDPVSDLSTPPYHCPHSIVPQPLTFLPPLHHTQLLQHVLFEYQFSLPTNTAERHAVAKRLWHIETLLRFGAPVECMLCQCAWAIWLSSAKVCSEPAAQSLMWMGSVPLYAHVTYVSEHYQ